MTNQHVFEQVWRHFVVERNEPGMAQGVCFLRGANDTRCAIGLLIPDRLYDESMENRKMRGPRGILTHYPRVAEHFSNVSGQLLESLQWAHDFAAMNPDADFYAEIEACLIEIAQRHRLRLPYIEEA